MESGEKSRLYTCARRKKRTVCEEKRDERRGWEPDWRVKDRLQRHPFFPCCPEVSPLTSDLFSPATTHFPFIIMSCLNQGYICRLFMMLFLAKQEWIQVLLPEEVEDVTQDKSLSVTPNITEKNTILLFGFIPWVMHAFSKTMCVQIIINK